MFSGSSKGKLAVRGSLVIILIVVVALSMGGFAWWYRYSSSRRLLDLWGSEAVELLRTAPEVELRFLRPSETGEVGETGETGEVGSEAADVRLGPQTYEASDPISLVGRPGFLHARQVLLEDVSYRWGQQPPPWQSLEFAYQLVFRDGDRHLSLSFAPRSRVVAGGDGTPRAVMSDVVERLSEYVERARPPQESADRQASETPAAEASAEEPVGQPTR